MKKYLLSSIAAATLFASISHAADLKPLNSDTEPDRINWTQLDAKYGPMPKVDSSIKIGGVLKTLTNEYWRLIAQGFKNTSDKYKVKLENQAAANENDQLGQLSIAETMITQGVKGLLLSPQSDANLQPAFESAVSKKIPVVNVSDAVIPNAINYAGPEQKDNGVRVANWFIKHNPNGGKVAMIEGQAGVFAATQRIKGFKETLATDKKFQLVASVPADWSREKAYNAAANILQQHPDLIGFYANNDTMALGVVEAVRAAGKLGKVAVFGTDGISDAYKSIQKGELTGTVDSFPTLTGEVATEVLLRLIDGQKIARVVATPQMLITKDNVEQFAGKDSETLRKLLKANK